MWLVATILEIKAREDLMNSYGFNYRCYAIDSQINPSAHTSL